MRCYKIFIILVFSISCILISGCSSVHVGGTGKIGGVHGAGEVTIPLPPKD